MVYSLFRRMNDPNAKKELILGNGPFDGTCAKLVIIHHRNQINKIFMASDGNYQSQVQTESQSQYQTLSPQQVLEARLLQLTSAELEERVRGELLDNPALEENSDYGPDGSAATDVQGADDEDSTGWEESGERDDRTADFMNDDDVPDYFDDPSRSRSADSVAAEIPVSDSVSFYDVLMEQLGERELTDRERMIAGYIIGSLDGSGMLAKSTEALVTELAVNLFIDADESEVDRVVGVIRSFEPAGIGARDLQDCLLLQLERKNDSPGKKLAVQIIEECFADFKNLRRDRIAARLEVTEQQIDEAFDILVKLNPRPGSSLGELEGRSTDHIIPDFTVESYDGQLQFSLNNFNVPELRVSRSFSETLDAQIREGDADSRQAALFIRSKLDAAKGFIDALHRREQTLTRTMQVILDLQKDFFLTGDETLLKPMILKDISERTGLDVSTVSRATSGKYAETFFGLVNLKDVFTDGITASDGTEVSVNEIYRLIREAVNGEDRSSPLTDDALAAVLKGHGYGVARRTVAKYREQLGIPVSRLRR